MSLNGLFPFFREEFMKNGKRNHYSKRLTTPASRHVRSLLKRHRPYQKRKVPIQPLKIKEAVQVDEPETAVKPISRRQQRKRTKLAQEEDRIKRLALEPDTSFGEMLFNPSLTMEKVATTDDITLSRGQILLLHFVKWAAVGLCLANNASHFVNKHGFSIAKLSFSDSAAISAKVMLFGLVIDYLCMLITAILGHCFDAKFSIRKFKAVKVRYYLAQTALYLVAAIFGMFSNAAGAVIYTITIVFSIMMRFHVYQLTCRFSTRRQLLIIMINVALTTILTLVYGHYAFQNLEKILLYILNF